MQSLAKIEVLETAPLAEAQGAEFPRQAQVRREVRYRGHAGATRRCPSHLFAARNVSAPLGEEPQATL